MISDDNIELLLNDILDKYGYDFTSYTRASLKRRLNRIISLDKFPSFAEFRYRINNDKEYFKRFVEEITVTVTEMFRDPAFYKVLRLDVLPKLATNPHIKIWHAGCSTGEEVFSMVIMLKELNLLHKSIIYATDINPLVLTKLSKGIIPLSYMKQYSENYIASGGAMDFSNYYTAMYDMAKLNDDIIDKIIYSTHNLATDGSFNEFHLILCRNVLIYFDKDLQDRALNLFDDSLASFGYLALGSKETIKFTSINSNYEQINKEKIWKKIK